LKVRSYPPQAVWISSSYYPEVVGGGVIKGQVLPHTGSVDQQLILPRGGGRGGY